MPEPTATVAAIAAAGDVEVPSGFARASVLLLLSLPPLLLLLLLLLESLCRVAMLLVEGALGAEARDHRATCASMHSSSSTSGRGASCSRDDDDSEGEEDEDEEEEEEKEEDWGDCCAPCFGAQGDGAPRWGRRALVYGLIVGSLGRRGNRDNCIEEEEKVKVSKKGEKAR